MGGLVVVRTLAGATGEMLEMADAPRTPRAPASGKARIYPKSGWLYIHEGGAERRLLIKSNGSAFTAKSVPFADASGRMVEDNAAFQMDSALDQLLIKHLYLPADAGPASTNGGEVWHDSTRKSLMSYLAGISRRLSDVVFAQTASVTVAGTGTETTLAGTGVGTLTLPANFFAVSKTLRISARGLLGTQATPNTLNLRIKLGSTVIVATGDQTPAGGLADRFWQITALLTCRIAGAGGTVIGSAAFEHMAAATGNLQAWEMHNAAAVGVDTTASLAIDLTADWGGAGHASDTIAATHLIAEVLG